MPTVIRWPGVIKPGRVIDDVGAHEDMLPTLLAANDFHGQEEETRR